MSRLSMLTSILLLSAVTAMPANGASITANANAQEVTSESSVALSAAAQSQTIGSPFSVFTPKAYSNTASIDYGVWDLALQNIVLRLGQSTRIRSKRPDPLVGTRVVKGHKSAYRLEGSRVTFSYLNDDYREGLTEYRKDLERVANQIDITKLAKNEQLAFWYNLHNVTLIEQIAHNYPVRRPSKLLVGASKQPLHEAKLLNIRGVTLSLRDIREKIVYSNWNNPDVIYGFFHGDIGSPALQSYAITSSNVGSILDLHANDFVNSLRGVNQTRRATKVSTLYEEARPYYFADWPHSLRTHLSKHAGTDVLEILAKDKAIEFDRYDPIVADLLAGDRPSTANLNVSVNGNAQSVRMSPEVARLFRELERKTEIMKKRGMILKRGTVTIEDVETIDVDIPDID